MSEEAPEGLVERLRVFARKNLAQGLEEVTVNNFIIGEDIPTGNLTVDIVTNGPTRKGRRCFMMMNREGHLMLFKRGDWAIVKELSYQLILEELANI